MSWFSRLRNHLRSDRVSRDIEREMRFHLDQRADDLVAGGMRVTDAQREARRRFGNVALQGERTRETDLFAWLDVLLHDLRYAFRSLRSAPAFTLVAILSLALGIGANTAIFSIINAVMLKSLPVSHPEELMMLRRGGDNDYFTNPLWEAIRDRQDVFSGAFAFGSTTFNLAGGGETRPVVANWVSGGYFTTLGVRPIVGRTIVASDDVRSSCSSVAMLSSSFWQSEYAADPHVVGKMISLNEHKFQIVGVTEPSFFGVSVGEHPHVFVPICTQAILQSPAALDRRSTWYLQIVGRLKDGVTVQQARARLATLSPGIAEATVPQRWPADAIKEYRQALISPAPVAKGFSPLRSTYKSALYILMVIVALVLAVACANVANLLLARAAARQGEMAVRLALGAGRGRLARQLITESLLLSLIGAAIGAVFAIWGSRLLVSMITRQGRAISLDLTIDSTMLLFTIGVTTLTGLLFGLAPAWRAGRVDPQSAMKAQNRSTVEGHSRIGMGQVLVVSQVALSLVLIAGAALLLESWQKLATLNPGFHRDGVLLVNANIHNVHAPEAQRLALFTQALDRIRALPGVQSASVASLTPVGNTTWNNVLRVDGFNAKSEDDALSWMNAVSDGFFTTMGIPLLSGRDFDARDVATATKVVIVSEAMARKFFGTPSVVGKRFEVQDGSGWRPPVEIVGVVGDTKYQSLRDSAPSIVYYPQAQEEATGEYRVFELRTSGPPLALVPAVKAAIAETNPRISLDITTMDQQLATSMGLMRAIALLAGFFGALALLLASIGLYGIMAYSVARRRNEIGVRIALGAEYGRVVRMVLGEVGMIVVAGVFVGLLLSVGVTRMVKSFLFGLGPNDPATMMVSAVVLFGVGIAAAALPAWRAARMDPVAALRQE